MIRIPTFAEFVAEDLDRSDLDSAESYADAAFRRWGIDVEFTKHFADRVNDHRNGRPITLTELIGFFNRAAQRAGKDLSELGDVEVVLKDVATRINVPFALSDEQRRGLRPMVAKTVMRTPSFMSNDLEIRF